MDEQKRKFAQAIVDNCLQMSTYHYCVFCYSGDHAGDGDSIIKHDDGCIVTEALAYLKEE